MVGGAKPAPAQNLNSDRAHDSSFVKRSWLGYLKGKKKNVAVYDDYYQYDE